MSPLLSTRHSRRKSAPVSSKNWLSSATANDKRLSKAASGLTEAQLAIVEVCAEAVQQLGLSRSVGQIFGVIYASPVPLAFTEVFGDLKISKGSVSQGLRFLREVGAIKLVQIYGHRREYFVPETELRRLLAGVLQSRLRLPLLSGVEKLKLIQLQLATSNDTNRDFLDRRLGGLRAWHQKALIVLPLVQRVLGK